MKLTRTIIATAIIGLGCSCSSPAKSTAANAAAAPATPVGNFNADSAYAYVGRQVDFGPRVPGSDAHEQCARWLEATLAGFGPDTVFTQRGTVKAFDGTTLPVNNIFASFNSAAPRRVLLMAHWDSRPRADNETDEALRDTPIDGANDGASGVGVLLEIARNLSLKAPEAGIDIMLFDTEDYGDPSDSYDSSDTWCLGSQYWAANGMVPYTPATRPVYGILLDMVGGRGAQFHRELLSDYFAPAINTRVWAEARRLGYDDIFINEPGGAVTDDHGVVTRAGIPSIDIIENKNPHTGSFNPSWHTHADNMAGIDRATLAAVGNTVLNVVYKEKAK